MTRLQRDRDAAVSEDGYFRRATVRVHLLQRSRFGEQRRRQRGGNLVEGDPSASGQAPQASTQAAQNTAQGDNATPLETSSRQRGNVESQRAAEAKAARDRRWLPSTGKGNRSNSELLRSSWTAWEQAWICCL